MNPFRKFWRWATGADAALAMAMDFRAQFPGTCMLCSYSRWGRDMGFKAAFKLMEPHPCPESPDGKHPGEPLRHIREILEAKP